MKRLLLLLAVLLWPAFAQAQGQPPVELWCLTSTGQTRVPCTDPTALGLHTTASISASVSGFAPNGNYATLTATGSSARSALPTNTGVVIAYNTGTTAVSCSLGGAGVTAVASQDQVPAGGWFSYTVGSNGFIACIDQTGSASNVVVLSGGTGLASGAGGGAGGGSGGSVTQGTSPWVDNISQFGGSNVVTGTGASGVGIPRVTVANDSVVGLAAGTNKIGTVDPASANNWGIGATGSAVPSNGVYIGINSGGNLTGWNGAVTGTVTANAGTNLNTSLLALETGGNLATVAGAVTSSVMQSNTKQVNGVTTLAGAGAVGTGAQRVAVGQDTTTIAGSAPGTAGTASANVLSVQGVASMTALLVNPGTIATWGFMAGTVPGSAPTNTLITGGIYNSSAPSPTTGQTVPLQLDSSGNLNVNIKAGSPSGGTSLADEGTFTPGTTNFTPTGCLYNTGSITLTSGQAGAFSCTAARSLHTTVDNTLTVNGGGSAGSANAGVLTVQGIASMTPLLVNPGTVATWGLSATGTGVPSNAVYIGYTVAGTLTGWDGNANPRTIATWGLMSGTTPGTAPTNTLISGGIYNSSAPSPTTGQTLPLQLDASGNLKAILQASATTAIGKVDPNTIATWGLMVGTTPATAPTNTLITGGIYNSSAPSPTTGQTVPLQLDSSGNLNVNIKAGAGSGGTASSFAAAFPATGTAIGVKNGANMVNLAADGSSNLLINCAVGCSSSGGSSIADEGTFTQGTTSMTVAGGFYNTAITNLTSGQGGAVQLTADRFMKMTAGLTISTLSGWTSGTSSNATQVIFPVNGNGGATAELLQLDQTTTLTGGAVTIEGTFDGTNWVTLPAANVINPTSATLAQLANPYTLVASTNQAFLVLNGGFQSVRIRLSTTITGSATVTPYVTLLPYHPAEEQYLALIYSAVTGAIPAGTAIIGKVGIDQTTPGTTNGISIVGVNAATALAGAGAVGTGAQRVAVGQDTTTVAGSAPGTAGSASANVVTVQGVASMTPLLVTPAANSAVNVAQVNGVTTLTGAGAVGTGSARVAVGQDTTTIAGSAPGTAGSASANVLTIQGVASMTPILANPGTAANWGVGATGSAVPANGVYQGINVAGTMRGLTGVNPSGSIYSAQVSGAGSAGTADANVLTVQGIASMTPLLVTPAANSAVNVAQINGVTPLMGNGVTGTGSQRVTVASDNTPFGVILKAGTTGAAISYHAASAASNNSTNIKSSAGTLYSLTLIQTTTTLGDFRLYDSASAPTCSSATGVVANYPVQSNAISPGIHLSWPVGMAFANGISYCITGAVADNDNTNYVTGLQFNATYD